MKVIYDIEIFKNYLLFGFLEIESQEEKYFEFSERKLEYDELVDYLRHVKQMIGFNNISFDYPLMYHFLSLVQSKKYKMSTIVSLCKTYANILVRSKYPSRISQLIPQVDLRLIHHYNNKAKMTSLKQLEFFMRMKNVQDLPIEHNETVPLDKMDEVIFYNQNDLFATHEFYKEHSLGHISLREELSKRFNIDMTNFNDVKIGESILVSKLKSALEKDELGQTNREIIRFKDVIFPYVSFESPDLNQFLNWLKTREIKETKGAFTNIPSKNLTEILPIIDISKSNLKRKPRKVTIEKYQDLLEYPEIEIKSLTINFKGNQITYGTGGVHQATYGNFFTDENHIVKSFDVKSYYPSMMITNNIYPLHLGPAFCTTMNDIKIERSKYPKGSVLNKALKLSGNGSYGKMNDKFSELRDPQAVIQITLNGQLMLTMLVEQLLKIEGCQLLMMNTDGGEVRILRDKEKEFDDVCKKWEELTKLELEYAEYKELYIRDCNNYIGIFNDNSLKKKGAYEYDREPHKNHSMMVVPKAVEAFYKDGVDIESFIRNHDDIFDYFKSAVKKNNTHEFVIVDEDGKVIEKLGKVTRYFISNNGIYLAKIMPPLSGKKEMRREYLEVDKTCIVCNNLTDIDLESLKQMIDYDYYIDEAKKLIINTL